MMENTTGGKMLSVSVSQGLGSSFSWIPKGIQDSKGYSEGQVHKSVLFKSCSLHYVHFLVKINPILFWRMFFSAISLLLLFLYDPFVIPEGKFLLDLKDVSLGTNRKQTGEAR